MRRLTTGEIKAMLVAHMQWLRGEPGGQRANLQGANLEGADLLGANLRGANLRGANLRGAYLRGAYLESADLESADLESAYLRGADLRGANLENANLESANLQGANLRGANLLGAHFQLKTLLAVNLQLIGACREACEWVDEQDQADLMALYKRARGDFQLWLRGQLGGEVTVERFEHVVAFVTRGCTR